MTSSGVAIGTTILETRPCSPLPVLRVVFLLHSIRTSDNSSLSKASRIAEYCVLWDFERISKLGLARALWLSTAMSCCLALSLLLAHDRSGYARLERWRRVQLEHCSRRRYAPQLNAGVGLLDLTALHH